MDRIPFSEDELTVIGSYPSLFQSVPPPPEIKTTIKLTEKYEFICAGERALWLSLMDDMYRAMTDFLDDNVARIRRRKDFFGLDSGVRPRFCRNDTLTRDTFLRL